MIRIRDLDLSDVLVHISVQKGTYEDYKEGN